MEVRVHLFHREPLPSGHPVTHLPNVVLTPHLGWPTDEADARVADAAADVLLAYLDGRDVPRFVARYERVAASADSRGKSRAWSTLSATTGSPALATTR